MSNLILYIVDHCLLNDKPKHNLHKLGAQTTLDFRKPEKKHIKYNNNSGLPVKMLLL